MFTLVYLLVRLHNQLPALAMFSRTGKPADVLSVDFLLLGGGFFILARLLLGDYNRRQLFWENARATTITLALIALADVFLASMIGPWGVLLSMTSWLAAAALIPIARQIARQLLSAAGLWKVPAAIFGNGLAAVEAYGALSTSLALGFDIRYQIRETGSQEPPTDLDHLQQLSFDDPDALDAALREHDCAQLVITANQANSPHLSELIQRAVGSGIGVVIIPALRGLPLFGMQTNYFFGNNMLLLQVRNNLARFPGRIIKRITDFAGAAVALLLLSPLFALIGLAVKLDSKGPIFFTQARVGQAAALFPCFKFRTMAIDAEEQLASWPQTNPKLYAEYIRTNFKLRNDPRVTRVGRILRRFSLDEFPQLLNVLMGHMSLVGPRPLLARELPEYGAAIDLYYCVRPGVTGLWQTRGRSNTEFRDRIVFDEWYILNWSYWYDVVILLQTVGIVLGGKDAY